MTVERINGRLAHQARPLTLTYGIYGNAQGSVLINLGNTRVLCSVMVQDGVPQFLRGTGTGWLTAEYALLPASTQERSQREVASLRRNHRAVEISRLIGRSLRAVVDLKSLGERTIAIDCDVLQADGGTRTAAITGAYCALKHAIVVSAHQQNNKQRLPESLMKDSISAISVGWRDGRALLDIDYQEDMAIDADFNFVMTGSGSIVEVQGAVEKAVPLSWEAVQEMQILAAQGIASFLREIEKIPVVSVIQ